MEFPALWKTSMEPWQEVPSPLPPTASRDADLFKILWYSKQQLCPPTTLS